MSDFTKGIWEYAEYVPEQEQGAVFVLRKRDKQMPVSLPPLPRCSRQS